MRKKEERRRRAFGARSDMLMFFFYLYHPCREMPQSSRRRRGIDEKKDICFPDIKAFLWTKVGNIYPLSFKPGTVQRNWRQCLCKITMITRKFFPNKLNCPFLINRERLLILLKASKLGVFVGNEWDEFFQKLTCGMKWLFCRLTI